jgi:hypothetical protein
MGLASAEQRPISACRGQKLFRRLAVRLLAGVDNRLGELVGVLERLAVISGIGLGLGLFQPSLATVCDTLGNRSYCVLFGRASPLNCPRTQQQASIFQVCFCDFKLLYWHGAPYRGSEAITAEYAPSAQPFNPEIAAAIKLTYDHAAVRGARFETRPTIRSSPQTKTPANRQGFGGYGSLTQ